MENKTKKNIIIGALLFIIAALVILICLMIAGVIDVNRDNNKNYDNKQNDDTNNQKIIEEKVLDLIDDAKNYYLANNTVQVIDLSKGIIDLKGNVINKGYVKFYDETNFKSQMYIDGYCVSYDSNNGINIVDKISESQCNVEIPNKVYKNGEVLYFNPTTGLKCDKSESKDYDDVYRVGFVPTTSGCMEWYVFLDDEKSTNVKLLLNHNINVGNNVDEVDKYILDSTKDWKQTVDDVSTNIKSRIISAEEITKIAPPENNQFNITDENSNYYFHTGNKTAYGKHYEDISDKPYILAEEGKNKYSWLINNLYSCSVYGCTKSMPIDTSGYWTSTILKQDCIENCQDSLTIQKGWIVSESGKIYLSDGPYAGRVGVRPVIEISKSIFE